MDEAKLVTVDGVHLIGKPRKHIQAVYSAPEELAKKISYDGRARKGKQSLYSIQKIYPRELATELRAANDE